MPSLVWGATVKYDMSLWIKFFPCCLSLKSVVQLICNLNRIMFLMISVSGCKTQFSFTHLPQKSFKSNQAVWRKFILMRAVHSACNGAGFRGSWRENWRGQASLGLLRVCSWRWRWTTWFWRNTALDLSPGSGLDSGRKHGYLQNVPPNHCQKTTNLFHHMKCHPLLICMSASPLTTNKSSKEPAPKQIIVASLFAKSIPYEKKEKRWPTS